MFTLEKKKEHMARADIERKEVISSGGGGGASHEFKKDTFS